MFYKAKNIGLRLASIEELQTVTPQNQHIIKKDMTMVSFCVTKNPMSIVNIKGQCQWSLHCHTMFYMPLYSQTAAALSQDDDEAGFAPQKH